MSPRLLLALGLAAIAGAWPFATEFGPVVLVLSDRYSRGIHTGDLAAVGLAAVAVHLTRPRSRTP